MTILPKLTNKNNPKNLLELFTKGHSCDYMFSGHTSIILIIILSFYKHHLIDTNEFKLEKCKFFAYYNGLIIGNYKRSLHY